MLIAAVACLAGAVAPAIASDRDFVSLELRLRPGSKPANPELPPVVQLKMPRDDLNILTVADADGIYRGSYFLLSFRDDPAVNATLSFDVRGPADRDLAKKTPKAGVSPVIPGFRVFENADEPRSPLLGIDDPEFGTVIALCVSFGAEPKFCAFDSAVAPGLIVSTQVNAPQFSSWRTLVKKSRERVKAALVQ